jgi:hypothetical protein
MGTWERRDIAGSPPLHSSLGIFCWGRSLKIQRDTKREVLTYWGKSSRPHALPSVQICSNSMYQLGMTRTDFVLAGHFVKWNARSDRHSIFWNTLHTTAEKNYMLGKVPSNWTTKIQKFKWVFTAQGLYGALAATKLLLLHWGE